MTNKDSWAVAPCHYLVRRHKCLTPTIASLEYNILFEDLNQKLAGVLENQDKLFPLPINKLPE